MNSAYKEQRRQALTKMLAALEADDEDEYCDGYDSLVETERDAGEFDEHDDGEE